MFAQVTINIKQLIDSLKYIYDAHGISFQVQNYYQAAVRLLAPIELIRNISKKSVKREYPETKALLKSKHSLIKSQKKNSQIKNQPKIIDSSMSVKPVPKSTTSYPISDIAPSSKYACFLPQTRTSSSSSSLMCLPSRTSLTPEQQQILCNWMRNQVQQGRSLTKTDVMRHAKIINKNNPMFHASTGWCRRFMMRNDDARILVQCNTNGLTNQQRRLIEKAQNKRLERHKKYQALKISRIKHQDNNNNNGDQSDNQDSQGQQYQEVNKIQENSDQERQLRDQLFDEQADEKNNNVDDDQKKKQINFRNIVSKFSSAVRDHKQQILNPFHGPGEIENQ